MVNCTPSESSLGDSDYTYLSMGKGFRRHKKLLAMMLFYFALTEKYLCLTFTLRTRHAYQESLCR